MRCHEDLGQRLTGARVTGLAPRQIRAHRHRPRGHARLSPGHVRTLADRSERDAKHDHFIIETDEGRRLALNDARRFGSLDSFKPTNSANGRHSRRSVPSRSTSTPSESEAPAGGPKSADQAAASRPAHHRRSRQYLRLRSAVSRRNPSGAGRRQHFPREAEEARSSHPRRTCRSDRCRRLDAEAILHLPTASSAISPKASPSMTGRGIPVATGER